ncbi:ribosome small subunit-dependent GTPase A [Thalassovita taeanensis]|uniref:ribosome small subunit-dependent GTPase A n=1 Tax=Thalassovita taeanensis TaxID=657014 RepID=UPI001FE269F6|nr:ribosome small subunit-dependent GTPase A [Thalassovita taeanensis]
MTGTSFDAPDPLAALGWSPHFAAQLTDEDAELTPLRIASVQRNKATGLGPDGPQRLSYSNDLSAADVAVGDWVVANTTTTQIMRILPRTSQLSRRAAGVEAKAQLLAANVDTLFITTSCNADFNLARLERYVVLALDAGIHPAILLTKADQCDDPAAYVAQATALSDKIIAVLAINAKDPAQVDQLRAWCGPGQTVAFVGSSGVGKSTIINTLTGADQTTADIRADDAKGRHTTTARSLHLLAGGGLVIDMPGMRELGLHDVAGGIDVLFDDIFKLAGQCRFRDCAHVSEPGCAVKAAIDAGTVSAERVERWRKLKSEDKLNTTTMGMDRKRARALTRSHRAIQAEQRGKKGDK